MDGSSLAGIATSDIKDGYIVAAKIAKFIRWIQYTVAEEKDPISYVMQFLRYVMRIFGF